MSNLDLFIAHLNEQVTNHSIYVWSAQGEGYGTISEKWIRKMETSENNANRAIRFWKKQVDAGYGQRLRAFDCSGLGMAQLMKLFPVQDTTADGMYKTFCTPINKAELKRGDWVFKNDSSGKCTHIGYVVDNNLNVVEAKGRDDGVVRRPLSSGGWNTYGRPDKLFDELKDKQKEDTYMIELDILRKGDKDKNKGGDKGTQVHSLQYLLNGKNNAGLDPDGSFGGKTDTAVRNFQKKNGLTVDGVVGKGTWTKLLN